MSNISTVMTRLAEMIDDRLRLRDPFRAIVTGLDGGMVTIRRLESTTGETELRARLPGYHLQANDEVLCIPVAGKPFILGPIQRSDTVTQGPEIGTRVAATGPVGTVVGKYQVFDSDGTSLGWVPIYASIT